MQKKRCTKCGELKSLDEFHKQSSSSDGHSSYCKTCQSKESHQYYINNLSPEELKKYKKNKKRKKLLKQGKYICRRCGKTKPLSEFNKNPSTSHGYAYACKDCRKKYSKKWYSKKKKDPEWAEHRRKQNAKRYYNGVEYTRKARRKAMAKYRKSKKYKDYLKLPKTRLNLCISSGIRKSIARKSKKGKHWEDLVDYNINELKQHLEKQFDDKMSWENYGDYWHIDHIIPISAFSFTKPKHIGFKKCWALENLQPLEAKENMRKSNKLMKAKQEYLVI